MANKLSNDTDSILYYSKSESPLFNKVYKEYKEEYLKRFKSEDEYGKYRWQYMATYSEEKFKLLESKGQVRWLEGSNKPEYKQYLHELKGIPLNNLWVDIFHVNPMAKESVDFKTQKPEDLLERIISIGSNEGDYVLDFFAGSGTTASVALKMKRKFITIEQMDYLNEVTIPRLCKIIGNGKTYDEWGVSRKVDWKGGGSFIYAELMKYNQVYLDKIQSAKSKDELLKIWQEMEDSAQISYLFDKKTFNERLDAFKTAPIDEMKQYLVEVLDKNQLYVNYSEIEDEQFGVSKEEIELNHQFYKKK